MTHSQDTEARQEQEKPKRLPGEPRPGADPNARIPRQWPGREMRQGKKSGRGKST